MTVASVVLRGYGNGTVVGTIAYVSTRGYDIGAAIVPPAPGPAETVEGMAVSRFAQGLTTIRISEGRR